MVKCTEVNEIDSKVSVLHPGMLRGGSRVSDPRWNGVQLEQWHSISSCANGHDDHGKQIEHKTGEHLKFKGKKSINPVV